MYHIICQEKTSTAWPKIQTHVLAYGQKIGPVDTYKAGALQTDTEACMDLWHAPVGVAQNRATQP
jgi:hypothetical protein